MWDYAWRTGAQDMPRMTPEYEFAKNVHYTNKRGKDATRNYRFDWCDLSARVAVEVDGGQWAHGGGHHASDTDREKLNVAASLRWLVFRFSPDQLTKNPGHCVDLVRQAIRDSL
jgi:very-short-patch-repair endonuclease